MLLLRNVFLHERTISFVLLTSATPNFDLMPEEFHELETMMLGCLKTAALQSGVHCQRAALCTRVSTPAWQDRCEVLCTPPARILSTPCHAAIGRDTGEAIQISR